MTRLTEFERKFLNEPICSLWPACACHENLERFQTELTDDRTLSLEQIVAAEWALWATCACVGKHCPDPEIRAYGAAQFAALDWRKQRPDVRQRMMEAE